MDMIDTKREAAIDDAPADRGRSGFEQGHGGSRLLAAGVPFAIAAVLLAVVFLLYGGVLRGWWRWDDPAHLLFVMINSPWQYFLVSEVWQEFSGSNLTPWLSLAYDADLWLFGLQPSLYYAHHLLALWLAAVLTYCLLRLWLSPLWSLLGAVLFLVGAPVATVVQQLMSRHYVEGLLFAVAALYCYILSLRRDSRPLSWLAGVCYLLAVTAKEVYVPLVCLLPFVREGTLKQRLWHAAPFLLVLAAYIPWRQHMLGVAVGGYATSYELPTVVNSLSRIPQYLFGDGVWGTVAIMALALVLAAGIALRYLGWVAFLLALALVLGPLVPLTIVPGIQAPDRYLFLPWWVLSCATVLVLGRFSQSGQKGGASSLVVYGLICAVALHQAWQTLADLRPRIDEMEVQGRFIWEADGSQALLLSPAMAAAFWEFGTHVEIKKRTIEGAGVPLPVLDEIKLVGLDRDRFSVWAYDAGCKCVKDISEKVPAILAEWEARRVERPLSVWTTYDSNVIAWRLGPYADGTYSVIGPWIGKVPVPREGGRRAKVRLGEFYVRYDSPEGWVTYSDPLTLSPDGSALVWQR